MPAETRKRTLRLLELELTQLWAATCGCWERSLGPLQEQQVLLTAEPSSFQPQDYVLNLYGGFVVPHREFFPLGNYESPFITWKVCYIYFKKVMFTEWG